MGPVPDWVQIGLAFTRDLRTGRVRAAYPVRSGSACERGPGTDLDRSRSCVNGKNRSHFGLESERGMGSVRTVLSNMMLLLFIFNNLPRLPVDPGVPKQPIKFKLSVRTGNPLLWVFQNLPANEATGHPPTVEFKQTKNSVGSRNAYIADSTDTVVFMLRGNKFECGG